MMDLKRKPTRHKNVFLFTNSRVGNKCSALYEIKISITEMGDGKYVIDSDYSQGEKLEPIQTFYDERKVPRIHSVAACVLGRDLLYVVPHDEDDVLRDDFWQRHPFYGTLFSESLLEERETLAPCLFDLSLKKMISKGIESPLARKNMPTLIRIGNTVFALSSFWSYVRCPEPCFESLVVTNDDRYNRWTPLACPPFHIGDGPLTGFSYFGISGVAALEEEGLILVSVLHHDDTSSYFSYNIRSDKWSSVPMDQVGDILTEDGSLIRPYLYENSVVLNNNIYTYDCRCHTLFLLPYTNTNTDGGDLSLGVMSQLEGFEFEDKYDDDIGDSHFAFTKSGTLTKVEDQILCVIHHIFYPYDFSVHHLCITFVQLIGDGNKCTTLKSFRCALSNGTEFHDQAISSCFVLNDLKEKSDHRSLKRPVMPSDADDSFD